MSKDNRAVTPATMSNVICLRILFKYIYFKELEFTMKLENKQISSILDIYIDSRIWNLPSTNNSSLQHSVDILNHNIIIQSLLLEGNSILFQT